MGINNNNINDNRNNNNTFQHTVSRPFQALQIEDLSFMQRAYMQAYNLPIHVAYDGYLQARHMFLRDLVSESETTSDVEQEYFKNIITAAETKLNNLNEDEISALSHFEHPMNLLTSVMLGIVSENNDTPEIVKRTISALASRRNIQAVYI